MGSTRTSRPAPPTPIPDQMVTVDYSSSYDRSPPIQFGMPAEKVSLHVNNDSGGTFIMDNSYGFAKVFDFGGCHVYGINLAGLAQEFAWPDAFSNYIIVTGSPNPAGLVVTGTPAYFSGMGGMDVDFRNNGLTTFAADVTWAGGGICLQGNALTSMAVASILQTLAAGSGQNYLVLDISGGTNARPDDGLTVTPPEGDPDGIGGDYVCTTWGTWVKAGTPNCTLSYNSSDGGWEIVTDDVIPVVYLLAGSSSVPGNQISMSAYVKVGGTDEASVDHSMDAANYWALVAAGATLTTN